MSTSSSYTADSTFSSSYTPSDSTSSWVEIVGTTLRVASTRTPASNTAAGTAGEICYDGNYIYVCTSANVWKRCAIAW